MDDKEKERKKQSASILTNFLNLYTSHFEREKVDELFEKYKGESTKDDYMAELNLLTSLNAIPDGLTYGFLAGVGTFMALRISRRIADRILLNRLQKAKYQDSQTFGSYKFGSHSSSSFQQQQQHVGQRGLSDEMNRNRRNNAPLLLRMSSFIIEFLISTYVGIFVCASKSNINRIADDVADIPLVEGRSVVSDELCDDFIMEYHKSMSPEFLKDLHNRSNGQTDDDLSSAEHLMLSIERFVQNCKRRRVYEAQLTSNSMSSNSDFSVSGSFDAYQDIQVSLDSNSFHSPFIPSPGVPLDIDPDLYDDNEHAIIVTQNEQHNLSTNDTEFDAFSIEKDDADAEKWTSFDNIEGKDQQRRK